MNNEPSDESNFVTSGGTSIKAVLFVEDLEHHLYPIASNESNTILDVLLHQKFKNLVEIVKSSVIERKDGDNTLPIKRQKLMNSLDSFSSDTSINDNINENILCYYSKLNYYCSKKFESNIITPNQFELRINWKYDTLKCVDATPLFVYFKNKDTEHEYVLIGSHSHQFLCLDANNGNLIWKFEANGSFIIKF